MEATDGGAARIVVDNPLFGCLLLQHDACEEELAGRWAPSSFLPTAAPAIHCLSNPLFGSVAHLQDGDHLAATFDDEEEEEPPGAPGTLHDHLACQGGGGAHVRRPAPPTASATIAVHPCAAWHLLQHVAACDQGAGPVLAWWHRMPVFFLR